VKDADFDSVVIGEGDGREQSGGTEEAGKGDGAERAKEIFHEIERDVGIEQFKLGTGAEPGERDQEK
jgi:hypothetical protein